jgi:hypothetical protein
MTDPMKEPATKGDFQALETRMTKSFDGKLDYLKDEILRHFDVTVEAIRHDLEGANKDTIETIKDDIVRLKRHTGLLPA